MKRLVMLASLLAIFIAAPLAAQESNEGQELFDSKCSVCHNADSKDKKIGPGLAGVSEGKLPSGKDTTEDNLNTNLNEGGNGMPAFENLLTDEEKAALVAYVMTL